MRNAEAPAGAQGRPRVPGARSQPRSGDEAAFLRRVDRALGSYLRQYPAPLVLVGPARTTSAFRARSRNVARLAGAVSGASATTPLQELAERIRPVLDAYLHSRQAEALALLDRRVGAQRVVSGIHDAWLAARHETPEMLAVDDTLVYPARLVADGDLLEPAADAEAPSVLDDAVDELIELVLRRGGWVALVDGGALDAHGGIALTIRGSG